MHNCGCIACTIVFVVAMIGAFCVVKQTIGNKFPTVEENSGLCPKPYGESLAD